MTSDYEKANVHMTNTRVNIFKRVLEEVQHQIHNFRGELYRQLLVLPATLEQQKRLIKYVLDIFIGIFYWQYIYLFLLVIVDVWN